MKAGITLSKLRGQALQGARFAAQLEIVEEAPGDWRADGMDLKYLRIYARDAAGRRVPDAAPRLRVAVEGPATLQALDNGDHSTDGFFNVQEKEMKDGFLLVVLRAGEKSGEVALRVAGEGLPTAAVKLVLGR